MRNQIKTFYRAKTAKKNMTLFFPDLACFASLREVICFGFPKRKFNDF